MKKLTALILALLMMFAFVACGSSDKDDADKKDDETVETTLSDAEKVAEYVAAHEAELLAAFGDGFSGSGMTSQAAIKANGQDIILEVRINEFDNLPEEAKQAAQSTLDSLKSAMTPDFAEMKKELPELEDFVLKMCEKDGDIIAEITIE